MKKIISVALLVLISISASAQNEDADGSAVSEPTTEGEAALADTPTIKPSKPLGRVRKKGPLAPSESSSFIGDPDNIDPLYPNRDNLKDDDEPVLEEIKDVLNAKKTKKEEPKKTEAPVVESTPVEATAAAEPPPPEVISEKKEEPLAQPIPEPVPEPITEPIKEEPKFSGLSPDEPDWELEKKFHDIYRLYNINPTPDDLWAAASAQQTARLYEVQKGDTLWSISKILFGDPNFWPKLWALNKQGILNPHFINPKMKIYFYEGDEMNSPTLTVGENQPVSEPPPEEEPQPTPEPEPSLAAAANSNSAELPKGAKPEDPPPQFAEAVPELDPALKVPRKKYRPPAPIPPSLPDSINGQYYGIKSRKDVKVRIDLKQPPVSEFFYNRDIVITDVAAQTDIKIRLSEVQKMNCYPGRLLKEIDFSGELLDHYDIYEQIDGVDTSTGYKYSYRLIGTAKSYREKFLRVEDCRGIMSTELVIVPRDRMRELATQKISDVTDVTIIGGPDFKEQKFYPNLTYAYVDFGPMSYNIGQEFNTVSEFTDKINGEFTVIDKYGSYAVVVITNIMDQLSAGDKVIPKNK